MGARGGPRGGPRRRPARPGPAGRGDALRRARLGLPARRGGRAVRAGRRERAARQLRPARAGRRRGAPLRRAVRAARRGARGRARAQARARRALGAGAPRATCRRGRASVRYRAAARMAEAERRADRDRAHRLRPGRDDPLPAGRLAGQAGAAGHGGQRGAADPPAARRDARADGAPTAKRAGFSWREDESNDSERFARARVRHGLRAGAARGASGGRGERAEDGARCCARRPSCSTGSSAAELAGRQQHRDRAPARRCRRRSRAWWSCAWPRTPPAPTCRRRAIAWQEILALHRRGGRAELHVGGQAGGGDRGRRARDAAGFRLAAD